MMKLKQEARYALVSPSSMGVRLTPLGRQPVHTSYDFRMQVTSAETNVLSISAGLGLRTKVLTSFVQGSPIAQLIQNDLGSRHIEYDGPEVPQGGAWGYRHQFNIADAGYGMRGPRVHNDRAGEVGRTLDVRDFDLKQLFETDGVQILHLSGLIAAISPETSKFCLELARAAQRHGTAISFDLNYRASFWKGREDELRQAFTEIAEASDVLIGNEEDFQLALGIKGPDAGGHGLSGKMDGFKDMIGRCHERFPKAQVFATTLRQVLSANAHLWGAILWADGEFHVVEPREIPVLDRIGGGDATVGGLLYGALKGWAPEKWLQFGWACGAMVVTLENDYGLPADEEQIWSIFEGNARVKR